MVIEYIFDPKTVTEILEGYPLLHQGLENPDREGLNTTSFPQARKTEREIYRILSNQHYPHLVNLPSTLEYCLKNGFEQPALLKTREQKNFNSHVAELFVASYFLKHNFKVKGLDYGKGTTSVPDILVETEGLSLSVEVYSPIDWDGFENFVEELRLGILHLDMPCDFHFKIRMDIVEQFDGKGRPLWFDPWRFSEKYKEKKDRLEKIGPILSEIEKKPTKSACLRDQNLNFLTEVHLSSIVKSKSSTPARNGTVSQPTMSGFAPEKMFDQLVEKRILKKINKRQAQKLPGSNFKAVFIDISRLGYSSEFKHPYYIQQFGQSVEKYLKPNLIDLDLVVFCLPILEEGEDIAIPLLYQKPGFAKETLTRLFGNRSFKQLSACA